MMLPPMLYRSLFLFAISLALKDCESLFVRHTKSGKCIAVGKVEIYARTISGRVSVCSSAVMTINCLSGDAQYLYLDNEVLHTIEDKGMQGVIASWGMLVPSSRQLIICSAVNVRGRLKQTDAGSLLFYNSYPRLCVEPQANDIEAKSYCNTTKQEFTFGSVTNYGTTMENVSCSPKQCMVVESADYGDFNNNGVFNDDKNVNTECSALASCQVKSHCGGERSCELTMNNELLPSQYCRPDTLKQIYTKYTCRDTCGSSTITTAANIRLTSSFQGYVEIKDNSIWRYVKDENWDEERQKMLCQYLGFSETKRYIRSVRFRGRHNIAVGDLICHKSRSKEVSCCVHLKPSKNTQPILVPYAKCKICETPINPRRFSGGGSRNYQSASLGQSSGWCASGTIPYLLIDLGREYHITRVVVMGNKDQTKWSELYSLRYSHSQTLVHRSTPIQITGNQNGYLYRASTTDVNIYNARYIKINSKKNGEFCLRIQLCGKVQSAAPVYEIKVEPSLTWAIVSWKLHADASASSHITQIVVYCNDRRFETVSREIPSVTVTGLQSNTWYIVGIHTVDGYLENSKMVYKRFQTKQSADRTYENAPTLIVHFTRRSKQTLEVSWDKRPSSGRYKICHSTQQRASRPRCSETNRLPYEITSLQPATKYFVTVSARTRNGFGPKSAEISKITNGEPVNPVPLTHSSVLATNIKPATFVKEMMVIVQSSRGYRRDVEDIKTSDLKPYQANTLDPYITAYSKINSREPFRFVVGDGKMYEYKNKKYLNKQLGRNSSYFVFFRYFENEDSYYSTEWSNRIKMFAKEDSIGSILSPKEAGDSATDVTTITTIVAATVGAGVFLSVLFNILLLTYKRRKKSDVVNIPVEAVDAPQEPLPNDQRRVYETIEDVRPEFRDQNVIESESTSVRGRTGHYQEVNVASTGRFLERERLSDDPGYLIPMIQQEQQHRSSSQDAAYEVPFHSVETPGYPQLDPGRDTKTGHTYQNILKVPGMHDQESFKMKKVEGNLSAYQELDQCRREVDNHVYQQLAKT